MPAEVIEVSEVIPASPERVYEAWLSSHEHTAMTGGKAEVNAIIGERFTAWDGYIEGVNLELEPNRRILQHWRTSEFPDESPFSKLELALDAHPEGTLVTLKHWDIPEGQGESYRSGWSEHYFEPMKDYFGGGELDAEVARADTTEELDDEDILEVEDTVVPPPPPRAATRKPAAKKRAKVAKKAAPKKAAAKAKAASGKKPAKRAAAARGAKKKVAAKSASARGKAPAKSAKKKPAAKSSAKKRR